LHLSKREGVGKWIDLEENVRYVGEWKNQEFHGKGVYTFANGHVKYGLFECGSFKEDLDFDMDLIMN